MRQYTHWYGLLLAVALVVSTLAKGAPVADAVTLLSNVSEARVLVLGELHGTNEAPALAAALARRWLEDAHATTLAVEVYVDEQTRIDTYLASSGADADRAALLAGPFWQVPADRNDGRRSVATLALLEAARERVAAGADLRVLAFDAGNAGGGANERNRRMAAVLRDAIARDPQRAFVVLIGNYHARRAAPRNISGLMPGESAPVPTMAHLADVPMLRINVSAASGEFWACVGGTCGARPVGGRGGVAPDEAAAPSLQRTPHDTAGWDAQLVLPRFSVAEPAVAGR